jgi:hypothetical protein
MRLKIFGFTITNEPDPSVEQLHDLCQTIQRLLYNCISQKEKTFGTVQKLISLTYPSNNVELVQNRISRIITDKLNHEIHQEKSISTRLGRFI